MASEHISIDNNLLSENDVIAKLLSQDYQLIFTHQEIQTDDIESLYVGTESLRVNSDAIVVPANKTETTFQEMAGFSFVVLRDIGIWQRIIEDNIPNAKFIYQAEVDDFNEIRRYSSLPYFTTNITQLTRERLEQSLRANLSNFWQAYRNNLEVIQLEKENLIAAKENYEIAMERYLLGDLPGIEMREAQKSLLDAEERILTAQYNTKLCEISLQQISGNVMTYME